MGSKFSVYRIWNNITTCNDATPSYQRRVHWIWCGNTYDRISIKIGNKEKEKMICKCGKVMEYKGSLQNGGYWYCKKCNTVVVTDTPKERN
jgi:hypothetical protein